MLSFLARRLASMAGVLFCVLSLTFLLLRLAPGGPFTRERKLPPAIEQQLLAKYHLDGSLGRQYAEYLSDVLHGDLRLSTKYRDRSVRELLEQSLPISALLGGAAFLLATTLGIWLGSIAAIRHGTLADAAAMLLALALISIPTFVAGPLLVLIFSLHLGILPVGGWNSAASLLLPALTLAGPAIASIARLTRTSLLETLQAPFLRTARAKGVSENRVVYSHALKTALLPVVSYLGPLAAQLLTGSIVVESIFNLPGTGSFFVNAILNRDVFLLGGVVLVYCLLLMGMNLLVDLLYTWLDPRIRLEA
ncbi:MAG: oligopeptide transport system permease protein [Verrucomicrobia bacterium]|nr:MAG: oligopeptide transport system permease protein [Verrucomicrobiota bacterium]